MPSLSNESKDRLGQTIRKGDLVRVLDVSRFMAGLPESEAALLQSMVGAKLKVDSIDGELIWVEQVWVLEPGSTQSHAIGLMPPELELVNEA